MTAASEFRRAVYTALVRCGEAGLSLTADWRRAEAFQSSCGGLGIQEPRSIEQGRARVRAMCPAVSRSISFALLPPRARNRRAADTQRAARRPPAVRGVWGMHGEMEFQFVLSSNGVGLASCVHNRRFRPPRPFQTGEQSFPMRNNCSVQFWRTWRGSYGQPRRRKIWQHSSAAPTAPSNSILPAIASGRAMLSPRSWLKSCGDIPCATSRLSLANDIHEGPLPKGGEGMRVSGSERWCSLTHKAARLFGQREETPHQPPAPYASPGHDFKRPNRFWSSRGSTESRRALQPTGATAECRSDEASRHQACGDSRITGYAAVAPGPRELSHFLCAVKGPTKLVAGAGDWSKSGARHRETEGRRFRRRPLSPFRRGGKPLSMSSPDRGRASPTTVMRLRAGAYEETGA